MRIDAVIHTLDRGTVPCISPNALRYSYFVRGALLEPVLSEGLPPARLKKLNTRCRLLAESCCSGASETELYSQTRELLYELLRPIPQSRRIPPECCCRRQTEAVRRFRSFDAAFSDGLRDNVPGRCEEERAAAREELRLLQVALEDAFSAQYVRSLDTTLATRAKNAREAVKSAGSAGQIVSLLLENRSRRSFLRDESEKISEIFETQRRNCDADRFNRCQDNTQTSSEKDFEKISAAPTEETENQRFYYLSGKTTGGKTEWVSI